MRYADRILSSTQPGKYFFLVIFFLLLFALSAFSQSKEEKKLRLKGIKALNLGNFTEAEEYYSDLLKLDPNNPDYNYEMGITIFEAGVFKGRAAKYFERAINNTKTDSLPEMFLYAGKAKQHAGEYDQAIKYYNTYRSILRNQGTDPLTATDYNIERAIEMCLNGKVQMNNSQDHIRIDNMGANINSEYADYAPILTSDENMILFTSRRKSNLGGMATDQKYFEDIYYSLNIDGTWTMASNVDTTNTYMSSMINTESHDATITFAGEESQVYIYRDLDVWISSKTNGKWSAPEKASGSINSKRGFEPSVFITQDEGLMFVVSDIGSGYGGRDLYISSKLTDGTWSTLKNLGKTLNTPFDEDAPFLTPDGKTLYFASTGHNSMGDYDIFKSELDENGEFSIPENLGTPINTPGHDRFFVTTDNGAIGYYASDREGTYGETDVYRIILDCQAVSNTIIRGVVFSEEEDKPVHAIIEIYDSLDNSLVNTYEANGVTGSYTMRLNTEKIYKFNIKADGYMPHEGFFAVPRQCDSYDLFQEIKIENLTDQKGRIYAQKATVNNAFFNIDKRIEERFEDLETEVMSDPEKDSLRVLLARESNPVEITNYVSTIEILDPKGIRLISTDIGNQNIATVQTRDVISMTYSERIVKGDGHYYADRFPEARAEYLIASAIKPDEKYPLMQVETIDDKLKNAPNDALLATVIPVKQLVSDMVKKEPRMLSGFVMNGDTKLPAGATVEFINPETGKVIKSINADPKTGKYSVELATNSDYIMQVKSDEFIEQRGLISIPDLKTKYDLFQEIRLENLRDAKNNAYAQKAIINNAFFNVDEKVEKDFSEVSFSSLSEKSKDSLRLIVIERTNPLEITRYLKDMELIDANGNSLAKVSIGGNEDEMKNVLAANMRYADLINRGDKQFEEGKLAEARAAFLLASEIKPNEQYPQKKAEQISIELANQPKEASLATLPEVDNGALILSKNTNPVDLSITKIRGIVLNENNEPSKSATIEIYDVVSGALVNKYNTDAKSGTYEMQLATGKNYTYKIKSANSLTHEGTFEVPEQSKAYDLYQEFTIEKMNDDNGKLYAEKSIMKNAFFNVDQKIIDTYPNIDFLQLSQLQIDSLRYLVTSQTNPTEVVRFVQNIKVIDTEGAVIASNTLGSNRSIPANSERQTQYYNTLKEADSYFASGDYFEARASYIVASAIKPNEGYPIDRIKETNLKLNEQLKEQLISKLPENDVSLPADINMAKIKGLVFGNGKKPAESAKLEVFDAKTGELVNTYNTAAIFGSYVMNLPADKHYTYKVSTNNSLTHEGSFYVPAQLREYDMYQQFTIEQLNDMNGMQYAEQTTMKNAFFDIDKKIKEQNPSLDFGSLSQAEINSLRSDYTDKIDLSKTENYAESIEVTDLNGTVLATTSLDSKEASNVQDLLLEKYNAHILTADTKFKQGELQAARASYIVASYFKPKEEYPKEQVKVINQKLIGDVKEKLIAAAPEEDKSQMVIPSENLTEIKEEVKPSKADKMGSTKPATNPSQKIVFRNILFDFDSDALRTLSVDELRKVSSYMQNAPSTNLRLDGHTDWIGSIEYNLKLSEMRAKKAYDFMITDGIAKTRLSMQYFGESLPIAPNANADGTDNPAGRQLNRRVEIKIDEAGSAENVILKF